MNRLSRLIDTLQKEIVWKSMIGRGPEKCEQQFGKDMSKNEKGFSDSQILVRRKTINAGLELKSV